MDLDSLVRQVFPPSRSEAIFILMLGRPGEVVSVEDMAVAAYGDSPGVWQYASSREWGDAARHHIGEIRERIQTARAPVHIENVFRRGYRLVHTSSQGDT